MPPYSGIEYLDPNRLGPQWLPQVAVSSVTKLHHTASRTLLTQMFVNPSTVSSIPTAQYTFPLYESCAIVAFRCYVGTRLIEGIIQEKDDASATFQAAVNRNEPASLLEQHTTDVFSTSIGNVPAGETVKVEIEYIMELKHDAEVDGLRFTIPTIIAPRYGDPPTGLSKHGASKPVSVREMNILVEVSMPGTIQSVESPSHAISLHLGRHSINDPDDATNPQRALVTLSQTTTELGRDFILLIKCASLSLPAALLEAHPTIPNSNALMVTLIPKFNLPISTRPEVVFIVDRSGSMSPRVAPLKSSLSVFLKSLPVDINFNICSFGSHHSFLWDRSRPYSNQTFAEAQEHCNRMQADFGGTEILPAIKSTIQRRLIGQNLEMMLLTDGEVWNSEVLFKYVEKETEKGDVRLFSLGIGRDVSHALVDGLARVGRGFSQVVSDEREGIESKVTRMLRGALSAHIVNYRLEWEGKPNPEEVSLTALSPVTNPIHRISLFDSHANTDSPVSFSDAPQFTIRTVIQAPHKIQPLFPFSRSTAYALVSSDAQPPSHVFLRGTTPDGSELEAEIAVQRVSVQGETVHQLAARKILQELKDGTSYVHGAVDKERQPALLAKWVQKEGVRVGLKYGVASHWTSFVAVERKEVGVVKEEKVEVEVEEAGRRDVSPPSVLDDYEDYVMRGNDGGMHHGGPPASHFEPKFVGGGGASFPVMMAMLAPPLSLNPTSIGSKHSNTRQKGRSAAPESNYSASLTSNDGTFYSDQRSAHADSSNPSLLIGNNLSGKGENINKPAKRSLWSALRKGSNPLRPSSQLSNNLTGGDFHKHASMPQVPNTMRSYSPKSAKKMLNRSTSGRPDVLARAETHFIPPQAVTVPTVSPHYMATSPSEQPRSWITTSVKKEAENSPTYLAKSEGYYSAPQFLQSSSFSRKPRNSGSSSAGSDLFGSLPPSDPPAGGDPGILSSSKHQQPVDSSILDSSGYMTPRQRHDSNTLLMLPSPLAVNSRAGTSSSSSVGVTFPNTNTTTAPSKQPQWLGKITSSVSARSQHNSIVVTKDRLIFCLDSMSPSWSDDSPSYDPTSPSSIPASGGPGIMSSSRHRSYLSRRRPRPGVVFDTPDIGILYSPSSAPPPERLSADTGTRPLSSRTKSLVDLQTFEGCFVLDLALAALLGVSLSDLEVRLISFVPTNPGLGPEYRKRVWATILAIKLFETQLAGERSVWQLVVDKARAWIAGVGVKKIAQFEKMAGEVLGA